MEAEGPFYHSPWVARVCRNNDPRKLGRVKVLCPPLFGNNESFWAFPLGTAGGGGRREPDETFQPRGLFAVPEVGSWVGLFCHGGDSTELFYLSGWWGEKDGTSEVPDHGLGGVEKGDPEVVVWELAKWKIIISNKDTPTKLRIVSKEDADLFYEIDADSGEMTARVSAKMRLEAKGSPDSYIELDGASGKIIINTPDLQLGNTTATEALVLGNAFLTLFNGHTHTYIPGALPPVATGTPNTPMVAGTHTSTVVKTA